MRIFAISQVHNEGDIIESLCRYTLLFSDGMIIFDNYSYDNTKEIICKLIDEGLPIYLAEWSKPYLTVESCKYEFSNISKSKDAMIRIAINQFHADLVVPVDADEFLFCPNGDNPRILLENLDPETEYHIPWRTFVFSQPPNDNTKFLPEFFPLHRVKEVTPFFKTVFSKNMLLKYDCVGAPGNHAIAYPNQPEPPVPVEQITSLMFAHYPLRGCYHAMSKSVLMEFVHATQTDRNGKGFQYQAVFDAMQMHGKLTAEEVKQLSIEYAVVPLADGSMPDIQIVKDPLMVPFDMEKLKLRYTDYNQEENQFFSTMFSETNEIIKNQTDKLRLVEDEISKLLIDVRNFESLREDTIVELQKVTATSMALRNELQLVTEQKESIYALLMDLQNSKWHKLGIRVRKNALFRVFRR